MSFGQKKTEEPTVAMSFHVSTFALLFALLYRVANYSMPSLAALAVATHICTGEANIQAQEAKPNLHLRLGTTKFRQPDRIRSFCISPSGKLLASAGGDETDMDFSIYIWDLNKGEIIQKLSGHKGYVYSLVFLADDVLVSCSADSTILRWTLSKTGLTESKVVYKHAEDSALLCMVTTPDRKKLFAGATDGSLIAWDVERNAIVTNKKQHNGFVKCLASSPCGNFIASGGSDNRIVIIDANSGKLAKTLVGQFEFLCSVEFSPNSKRLVSGNAESKIGLWDLQSEKQVKSFSFNELERISMIYSADGKDLYVGVGDALYLLDSESLMIRKKLASDLYAECLRLIPERRLLVCAGADRFHYFFDTQVGRLTNTPIGHLNTVVRIAFSSDDKALWSACDDGFLVKWDVISGTQLSKEKIHGSGISAFAFAGNKEIVAVSNEGHVATIKYNGKKSEVRQTQYSKPLFSAVSTKDSKKVLIGGQRGVLLDFQVDSQALSDHATGIKDSVFAMAISPKTETLSFAGNSSAINVYDLKNRKNVKTISTQQVQIRDLVYSCDGQKLASAGLDGSVEVWEVATGKSVSSFQGHSHQARSVSFFAKDFGLISGGFDGRIIFWDIVENKKLKVRGGPHCLDTNQPFLSYTLPSFRIGNSSVLLS
jgi:WD40 repeat protein